MHYPPTTLVGIGQMGAPLARRLHAHGVPLTLYDVRAEALDPFREMDGVRLARSVAEACREARFVVLSLPSPAAVLAVVAEIPAGASIVVDTSTGGPAAAIEAAQRLAARGHRLLDAPVSGGATGAAAGTLTIMLAGDPATIAEARPLLELIGRPIVVGERPGQGQALKLVNNVLSATIFVATAEALAVATKAGIRPRVAIEALNQSTGRSDSTEQKFPADVLTGAFAAAFTTALMAKDVRLFAALAEQLGVPTVVTAAGVAALDEALAAGFGPRPFTAVAQLVEGKANVAFRDAPDAR